MGIRIGRFLPLFDVPVWNTQKISAQAAELVVEKNSIFTFTLSCNMGRICHYHVEYYRLQRSLVPEWKKCLVINDSISGLGKDQ